MAVTLDEAAVIMDRHLPVLVEGYTGVYFIESISKYMDKHIRKYEYSYVVSTNGRCVFTVDRFSINVSPEFENNLKGFTKQYKRKMLKYYIRELVNDGGNKTTITKIVKDLIDEIKKENK